MRSATEGDTLTGTPVPQRQVTAGRRPIVAACGPFCAPYDEIGLIKVCIRCLMYSRCYACTRPEWLIGKRASSALSSSTPVGCVSMCRVTALFIMFLLYKFLCPVLKPRSHRRSHDLCAHAGWKFVDWFAFFSFRTHKFFFTPPPPGSDALARAYGMPSRALEHTTQHLSTDECVMFPVKTRRARRSEGSRNKCTRRMALSTPRRSGEGVDWRASQKTRSQLEGNCLSRADPKPRSASSDPM